MNSWITQVTIFTVLSALVFYIFVEFYFFAKEKSKVKKLTIVSKFINKKISKLLIGIYILVAVLYLMSLGLLIYCLIINTKETILINSIVTLFVLLVFLFFFFYVEKIFKSAFFVIYEDNVIVFKNTFKISSIQKASNDLKRKNIFILFENEIEDANEYIVIKYNWKIKELLIENIGEKYDKAS